MRPVIIDNYDSFTYNLFQFVQELSSEPVAVFRNDKIALNDLAAMNPTHVILSPGPGHPANDSDFGVCKDVILQRAKLRCAILGVCLGHQGIVHHLGGKVERAPRILHGKTSDIDLRSGSKLFLKLPPNIQAMRYHSLIARDEELPAGLTVTARDTKDQLIMAVENSQERLYGVQFHPESIGTPFGKQILRNFLEAC
jgi:anthranilate synthase/aminodeoxychorismate synthase-like glutamine amidotransferase